MRKLNGMANHADLLVYGILEFIWTSVHFDLNGIILYAIPLLGAGAQSITSCLSKFHRLPGFIS